MAGDGWHRRQRGGWRSRAAGWCLAPNDSGSWVAGTDDGRRYLRGRPLKLCLLWACAKGEGTSRRVVRSNAPWGSAGLGEEGLLGGGDVGGEGGFVEGDQGVVFYDGVAVDEEEF